MELAAFTSSVGGSASTEDGGSITEPIPISKVAGRYLLFDINVVTYLRRAHNICGVLVGGLPQIPQQNVFLGLPVELLPEEAKVLVEKEVAYLVDDAKWHKETFKTVSGDYRKKYLESLRAQGRKARKIAEGNSQKRAERGLAKQALLRASKDTPLSKTNDLDISDRGVEDEEQDAGSTLFDTSRAQSPAPSASSTSASAPYAITPTTSYSPLSLPQNGFLQEDPPVPASYPLFAHLHAKDYFITPGLRFGCDYTVYPGDPLRFHSHFLAVGYEWDQKIPLIDLVGGGRLGTGVKKGFLIGGESPTVHQGDGESVRTFCIEWGGM